MRMLAHHLLRHAHHQKHHPHHKKHHHVAHHHRAHGSGGGGGGTNGPSSGPGPQLGLNNNLGAWILGPAQETAQAQAMGALGTQWARISIDWQAVEWNDGFQASPGSDTQWVEYDRAVQLANANGMNVLLEVYRVPAWAADANGQPDPDKYASFLQTLATRYGSSVKAIEVWNEPNGPFWPGGANPEAFAALLKAAYPAVKAVEPSIKVVTGGLFQNDAQFLQAAYQNGIQGNFDVLGLHPYSCSDPPSKNTGSPVTSFLGYRNMLAVMDQHGDRDKPVWFTEFGWGTAPGAPCTVSPDQQAANLVEAVNLMKEDPRIEVAMWYNYLDDQFWTTCPTGPCWETTTGLVDQNGAARPALAAFAKAAKSRAAA